mgnify:CR=1 FL=1
MASFLPWYHTAALHDQKIILCLARISSPILHQIHSSSCRDKSEIQSLHSLNAATYVYFFAAIAMDVWWQFFIFWLFLKINSPLTSKQGTQNPEEACLTGGKSFCILIIPTVCFGQAKKRPMQGSNFGYILTHTVLRSYM